MVQCRAPLLAVVVCALAAPLAAGVRAISDNERAAVDHAVAYLSGGPDALVARLTPDSPLRGRDAAKEIEARLGPPDGASWELQTVVPALADRVAVFAIDFPSGVDETATFELAKDGRIETIRILAEESQRKPLFPAAPAEPEKEPEKFPAGKVALALALGASICGSAASLTKRAGRRIAIMTGVPLAIGAAAITVVANLNAGGGRPRLSDKPKSDSLAPLVDLRRAIAAGREVSNPGVNSVARLWKAQVDVQQMRIEDAKKTLASFPSPSTIPLVEMLRGRVALFDQDDGTSALAYEHAVNLGPGRDGLWSEAAHALLALGFEDRSLKYLERLERIGTRDAGAYYTLSMFRAMKNREDDAAKLLATGWSLRPARRRDVIAAQVLWSVIRKPLTATFMDLGDPDEKVVKPAAMSSRAIALPPNATARVSGDYLAVQIGDRELRVPGGACLAPAGTPVIDAGAWARMDDEKAIGEYDKLVAVAGTAGAFTQPELRERITRTANALAERHRWPEIVRLTDGLSPRSEHVPPMLFFLRAAALERTGRTPNAKQLLAQVAAGRALQRRHDARALEELGDMFASIDEYDAAVKMLDKAEAIKHSERIEFTVSQIQMNKRLATRYSTYNSGHFEIHYPDDVSPVSAKMIGGILESELQRMQTWVPTPNFKPVVVNVVWWHDFASTLTGNEYTLGTTYRGKITVPFAGVPSYPPEVVAILTHELCHAMISDATDDQAPRWFQEGMAQRMEMIGLMRNAFNMYDDPKLLAFSLLDDVMNGSPDPEMIGEGYLESEAAIRYIEAKYGRAGLAKLMQQFRAGATTDEAISALSGTTPAEFDRQFRQWGRSEQRVFETPIAARYDQ